MLQLTSISKSYKGKEAVNNISLSVSKGEIFGLLGPNGAGKTTTIRMIMNIITPDSGNIRIFNENSTDRIGYLPEERGLYKKRKVIEVLVYFGMLKGMNKADALDKANLWLKRFDLDDYKNKRIAELSKGMQQKVQFIAAIIHDPDLVILDEPFSGLDPINVKLVKDIILEMKNNGRGIILSTHIMEQAEKLCDKILLINNGNDVLSGKLSEIKKNHGTNTIIIEFNEFEDRLDTTEIPFIKSFEYHGNHIEVKMDQNYEPQELLKYFIGKNIKINKFEIAEPSLNEIFMETINKNKK